MIFEEVWEFTKDIGSEAAFSEEEARALHRICTTLSPYSTILEVGCEYGRSTSVLAQMAKALKARLYLVDPFIAKESFLPCMRMLQKIGHPFTLFKGKTEVLPTVPPLHLLHIDGDHSTVGIGMDCFRLLPHVAIGGHACFHDCGRNSLPTVWPVVDSYTRNEKWQVVETAGTLHIVTRVKE